MSQSHDEVFLASRDSRESKWHEEKSWDSQQDLYTRRVFRPQKVEDHHVVHSMVSKGEIRTSCCPNGSFGKTSGTLRDFLVAQAACTRIIA